MNELLLSDDELDLIWCLPYITEKERLKVIAKAQVDNILESSLFRRVKSQNSHQNMREWWRGTEKRMPKLERVLIPREH